MRIRYPYGHTPAIPGAESARIDASKHVHYDDSWEQCHVNLTHRLSQG